MNGSQTANRLTVVGIGASAGGLSALCRFFEAIPADSGMAFVVITHMAPDQESYLPQVLQKHTGMPVSQVQGRLAVEPNCIYVIPPGRRILMTDTHVDAEEFSEPRGHRTPVDDFFRSLAEKHREAVAVILSGSGTDGAVGIKAIKEKEGLLLVQHPDEAEYDSMPQAAIATGLADVVLPVAELAEKLLAFYRDGRLTLPEPTQLSDHEREMIQRILVQVQIQTGHDLSQYRHTTLLRRIIRRMNLHQFQSLDSYLAYLRQNPEEANTLFNDLLVGVTTFFRAPQTWQALAEQVMPRLFAAKKGGEQIRIWSIGCATGEEAYSLAMLLMEEAARLRPGTGLRSEQLDKISLNEAASIQIFASDLSEPALHRARQGVYPEVIEADLSPERLERFFVKEGPCYRIRPELRDMVLFTSHSVLYDPPFSRLDLISSRNLLTHLQRPLRQTVLEIFYYALNPGGYLFLDKLDAVEVSAGLFQALDRDNYIYTTQSQPDKQIPIPKMPFSAYQPPAGLIPPVGQLPRRPHPKAAAPLPKPVAEGQHRQALETIGPPSLLVNELYEVLHLSETAGRYLQPQRGPMTPDLLKLVRPELRLELQNTLSEAFQEQKAVLTAPIPVHFNGVVHGVIIAVNPYRPEGDGRSDKPEELLALVCFLEDGALFRDRESLASAAAGEAGQGRVAQLEQEVQQLRNRLLAVTEQYEIANEELRVANEELQSTNEEFRSTNEELQTSREEIQSINEELRTTNTELDQKVAELSRSHSDIENLMTATNIPTLFLDRNLFIQRYTPTATQLLPLQPHDRGRHISHLVPLLNYDTLVEDAQRVLTTLMPAEREIQDQDGCWLLVRQQPYLTPENRIDGVVLTFININALKQTEKELRQAEERLEQRVLERTAQVRQLASEMITLEQTVRQRIAQSLHDNLQQSLYAAKIQLQFLRDEVGEKEELSQLDKTISHSLDLTRQITVELSPPILEEEGLPEALSWLAEHMHELYGLRVHVKTSAHPDTATKEQRVLFYQIVRELLFNVVKHAGVQEAEVLLQEKDEALMVIVSDHGRGFDVAEKTAETSAGFGLRSIHERLQLFDGWAELNSQLGAGTRVHLFLPHHRSTE